MRGICKNQHPANSGSCDFPGPHPHRHNGFKVLNSYWKAVRFILLQPPRAGKTVFKELLFRKGRPRFYAFDLVWLNGEEGEEG